MPKKGMPCVPRVLGRLHHAARAARPESAGHEDADRAVEQARAAFLFERFRLDPLDVDAHAIREAAVIERLVQRLVGILVARVLADDVNGDLVLGILDPMNELLPRLHVRFVRRQVQVLEDDRVEALVAQRQRHFVDRRDVARRDHRFLVDVAEQRDLLLDVARQDAIGAAQQDVGLDTDRAQVAHAVLRRLGLQLAGGADVRHQRQVHVDRVLAADVLAELANRFEERQALDVADRAADFDEHDVGIAARLADAVLDLVGDVRNHLHGAAEIIAAALLLDHRHVDLAGRPVAVPRRGHAREPLVVAQVEVRLGAVVGDVDLAVLIRAHRARIDVDVRIELLQADLVAVAFEQGADRRGGQALAERRHHAAGHEDVFRLTHAVFHRGLRSGKRPSSSDEHVRGLPGYPRRPRCAGSRRRECGCRGRGPAAVRATPRSPAGTAGVAANFSSVSRRYTYSPTCARARRPAGPCRSAR